MWSLRDVILFLAGAEFFHTIFHFILPYIVELPLQLNFVELTPNLNYAMILVNALITALLLFWAYRLKT